VSADADLLLAALGALADEFAGRRLYWADKARLGALERSAGAKREAEVWSMAEGDLRALIATHQPAEPDDIAAKFERSSFGTPEAQALRATVSDEHAARIVARARELEAHQSERTDTAEAGDACHHCGRLPEADGDHTCTCPFTDSECLEHTLNPVERWPFGDQSAAILIARVSSPWEQPEQRDSWAPKMLTDRTMFEQEATRAQKRLAQAIAHIRAAQPSEPGREA
jgi:hypothetical protein